MAEKPIVDKENDGTPLENRKTLNDKLRRNTEKCNAELRKYNKELDYDGKLAWAIKAAEI